MNITFFFNSPRKAKESSSPYSIYVGFRFRGIPFKIKTEVQLRDKWFNPGKKIDNIVTPQYTKDTSMNRDFAVNEFKKIIINIEKVAASIGDQNSSRIELNKLFAQAVSGKEVEKQSTLLKYFNEFYEIKTTLEVKKNTAKTYIMTKAMIENIVKVNPQVDFDVFDIDHQFFIELRKEAERRNYERTTYNKHLKNFKVFMNDMVRKYPSSGISLYFKQVPYLKEINKNPISLTAAEIEVVENASLELNHQKHIDMWLFQMYLGQRHEGIYHLRNSLHYIDETNKTCTLYSGKTGDSYQVPLIEPALKIYRKYKDKGKFPLVAANNRNSQLQKIFEILNLNREVEVLSFPVSADEPIMEKRKLYEVITTHKARATLITLALKHKVPFEILKQMTGHSDARMLELYNTKDHETVLKQIGNIFEK